MNQALIWNEMKLSNGLIFLYAQNAGVPLAAGTILLRLGSAHETAHQAGVAALTADLLLQGTRRRSASRLALEIESVGGALGLQASEDYSELDFVVPIPELDRILDVLADILINPTFEPSEIKKEKASALAALKGRKDAIFNVAYDALTQALYNGHPYSRPVDGKAASVAKLNRSDFKAWHTQCYRPDQAILSLVGSASPEQVQRQVDNRLCHWITRRVKPNHVAAIKPIQAAKSILLRSRFEQAYLMVGVSAPSVGDGDYLPLKVLNMLFGGGMSSRLFQRLREELGLAYEVSSFSPAHLLASHWVCYLGTPPDRLDVAKRELEQQFEQLLTRGPSQSEVDQSIAMIKGSFLLEQQTRRRQAWYAAWWKFLGRSLDYGAQFVKEIETVTPKRAHDLARSLLAQPQVTVQVVPK